MKRRISVQFCLITTSSSESVTRLSSQPRIGGGAGKAVPVGGDMLRRRLAEDEAFEQGIGGEPVGAVQAGLADLAHRIEAGQIGAPVADR